MLDGLAATLAAQPLWGVTITALESMASAEAGAPVTFSATVAGGTPPYSYQWWIFRNDTRQWTVAQVWVRDSQSTESETGYDTWAGSGVFIVTGPVSDEADPRWDPLARR